jgi:hypothetical protein
MKHQVPKCEYAYQRQTDIVCFKQTECEYKSKYPDFHIKYCKREIIEDQRRREKERELELRLINSAKIK